MYLRLLGLILTSGLIAGCSNQQVYETIRHNQQLDCQKMPDPQYEDCMQQAGVPYTEYKKQREELLRESE